MRQTTMAKPNEVVRQWYVVDGQGLTLGRLASEVATVLRGKHKPTYTPNVDCGDSMHPGGLRVRTTRVMREQYTVEWVEKAIKGMLPHTKLGDVMRTHLFVYTGSEHPHQAQKPVELKIKG